MGPTAGTRARPPRPPQQVLDEPAQRGLAARLDVPMGVLGVVFLLVVLAQTISEDPATQDALAVVSWVLWAAFVAEFVVRLLAAPSRWAFLRRHWWQVLFLLLPVLRFARAVALVRLTRAGRVLSSAVRTTRSARGVLSSRVGWLAAATAVVVLAVSQLLYLLGYFATYADALHATALATVVGEPLGKPQAVPRLLDVVLAVYSVAVFAGLAGALGAYFLHAGDEA